MYALRLLPRQMCIPTVRSGFASFTLRTMSASAATDASRMTAGSSVFCVAARNSSSNTWL